MIVFAGFRLQYPIEGRAESNFGATAASKKAIQENNNNNKAPTVVNMNDVVPNSVENIPKDPQLILKRPIIVKHK